MKFINADDPNIIYSYSYEIMSILAYDYCQGNPVLYVDYTGQKGSFRVLTINQFYNESKEINKILSKILSIDSPIIYKYNGAYDFANKWNKSSGCDIIVINSHGNPKGISFVSNSDIYSSRSKIKKGVR